MTGLKSEPVSWLCTCIHINTYLYLWIKGLMGQSSCFASAGPGAR